MTGRKSIYNEAQWRWAVSRFYEGYTVTDIANVMGMTANAIKYQIKKRGIYQRTEAQRLYDRPLVPLRRREAEFNKLWEENE